VVTVRIDLEQLKACRVCGHQDLSPWRDACRDTSGTVDVRFAYVRCAGCGAAQLSSGPSSTSAGAFYPDEYAPYNRPSPAVLAMFRPPAEGDKPLLRLLRSIYGCPPADARLLDFGCGSPATLDAARESGWSGTGVDFSPLVVDAVRAAGHEAMLVDDFESRPTGSYDVIRGNHVVEHVYDPPGLVTRLLGHLRPGGVLHLATPNPDGVGSRLFGRHWFSLDAPRHVVLFPPALLASMLLDAGAADVQVAHEVVTKDIVRSGTYLRQQLLGGGGADVTASDGSALLNRAARPLAELAARRGASDRYHVFAYARE
jgi:2-polyprenyl-3-methyl-5-hydroxy-6-metoxy-1,4-benzoquinol methylase